MRDDINITIECRGYGKPTPDISWKKNDQIVQIVKDFGSNYTQSVVQVVGSGPSLNVTSRLYLRTAGVTYEEAGNYTCEVSNGVLVNQSSSATIEVLCKW